jgi:hypothetical protein
MKHCRRVVWRAGVHQTGATQMRTDKGNLTEGAQVGAHMDVHDAVKWKARWLLNKFHAVDIFAAGLDPATAQEADILAAGVQPYETIEREGNLLMYGGASCLWECLIGNGTGTASQTLTYFNNGNAHIGVGDSTTAAAATQTDLQASSNKLRKAMDATFPTHTDGVIVGAASIQFKSTFGTSDANWDWEEWGVFNAASGGRMLNRKVEDLGTKTGAASWAFTVTLTLA